MSHCKRKCRCVCPLFVLALVCFAQTRLNAESAERANLMACWTARQESIQSARFEWSAHVKNEIVDQGNESALIGHQPVSNTKSAFEARGELVIDSSGRIRMDTTDVDVPGSARLLQKNSYGKPRPVFARSIYLFDGTTSTLFFPKSDDGYPVAYDTHRGC